MDIVDEGGARRQPDEGHAGREAVMALIPEDYRPGWHLLLPTLATGFLCVAAATQIQGLHPLELLVIPAMLVISNLAEWVAHRYMLHERLPLVGTIYERHELHHHIAFTHENMAMRSRRELWMILVPAYAVLVILVSVTPFALLAGVLVSSNAAPLVVISALGYFITYEWLHLSYHLPASHPVSRWRLIAKLRRLHQRHHDPRLMKRWNFNVTFGLFDWLLGTLWSPERERQRHDDSMPIPSTQRP